MRISSLFVVMCSTAQCHFNMKAGEFSQHNATLLVEFSAWKFVTRKPLCARKDKRQKQMHLPSQLGSTLPQLTEEFSSSHTEPHVTQFLHIISFKSTGMLLRVKLDQHSIISPLIHVTFRFLQSTLHSSSSVFVICGNLLNCSYSSLNQETQTFLKIVSCFLINVRDLT